MLSKWMLLSALVVATVSPASANLVTNGGFETGSFAGWTATPAAAGSNFGVVAQPHTGQFAAFFQATGGQHDQISQILATTMGTTYTIGMWVNNGGVGEDSLQLVWEGATVLNMTPVGTPLEDWTYVETSAPATMNGSSFAIRGYDTPAFFLVDDVSVAPVPEPASFAILSLGVLTVVRRRLRSR